MKDFSGKMMGLFVLGVMAASIARAEPAYHFIRDIPVGGEGGWDYLAMDAAAHRLYVSHATKIIVIDTKADSVVGEIDGTPGVHGFALAPDLQRGFSSNGREAKAGIVDLRTLKTLGKVDTGENPDAIVYASRQHEVYTFNGKGHSATVFNAGTGKVVATIALPGKPEFAVYDPASGVVFDNIEDKNEVVAIDAKSHRVVKTWPIAPGAEASGLAIDLQHHRLFIGCHNQLMLMMDGTTGKVLSSVPIYGGVDACAFDPGTQLAFSSTGEGVLTIAREDASDRLTVIQNLVTQKGARTMALDPGTHKIYLATALFKAPVPAESAGRPVPIPGTFKILVYGM